MARTTRATARFQTRCKPICAALSRLVCGPRLCHECFDAKLGIVSFAAMPAEIAPEKLAELKSLGGDTLITKLLEKFVENSARLIADGQAALTSGDATKVDYCVHTLKGSAMSLGLNEMSELLINLNVRTKARNLEGAAADFTKLAAQLAEVRAYKAAHFP
jgi:HPt (histidine-containing phosphotransfer) domain-containing protein